MNILLLGSGGREHALAWKIDQSPLCNKLYIAPGNPGTNTHGENIDLNILEFESIKHFVDKQNIDLIVVGPEDPLVNGIYDFFEDHAVKVFGPSKLGAMLEGSKDYAKVFMKKHNIPTATFKTFNDKNLEEGYHFIDGLEPPYVLKADGLAAGKGVLIINDKAEAKRSLKNMIQNRQFGNASDHVVVEAFLKGIEISVFAITDGTNYKIIGNAKDYKRVGENDTGLNTGGMGAISPVPFADKVFMSKVEEQVIIPTVKGLKKDGIAYKGIIYFGLMNVSGEPKVIEYNVRLGDPEAEILLPRLKNDLLSLILSTFDNDLPNQKIVYDDRSIATIIMVSGGYPEKYEKGIQINGLEHKTDSIIFHAGTKQSRQGLVTNGGRVLAITSYGDHIHDAIINSYNTIKNISFDKAYYRKDIGFDVI
jgi:phosphoribosylamine--glycine ligase